MHYLRDHLQGGVIQGGMRQQNLKCALVAFVREFTLEHVEAELALSGNMFLGIDKPKRCRRIDESSDEPGTRHTVNFDTPPGHPDASSDTLQIRFRGLSRLNTQRSLLNGLHNSFQFLPARRSEEIDSPDLVKLTFQFLPIQGTAVQGV